MINHLNTSDPSFQKTFQSLLHIPKSKQHNTTETVHTIIEGIKKNGDTALLEYCQQFDNCDKKTVDELIFSQKDLEEAYNRLPEAQRIILQQAHDRIHSFHTRQKLESWTYIDPLGNELGQIITPIEHTGIYAPGGSAAYPSSVLMSAIPAKIAGVSSITLASPSRASTISDLVLGAAFISGVTKAINIGGAQAIAALAFGTQSIPKVDKIVGPGNAFVAEAKKQVFGQVGIDSIAGPSEVVIVSDGTASPQWLAYDLCAQAEHDALAQSILLTPDAAHIQAILNALDTIVPELCRRDIIKESLKNRGALIQTQDIKEAAVLANEVAPEHLQLAMKDPNSVMPYIRNASALFYGIWSPEVLGDYLAGPNHILPTFGTARFSSPLGVYDFQKRSSLIACSEEGSQALLRDAATFAHLEGLTAHAGSAECRIHK